MQQAWNYAYNYSKPGTMVYKYSKPGTMVYKYSKPGTILINTASLELYL